jgi:hypothetical protein
MRRESGCIVESGNMSGCIVVKSVCIDDYHLELGVLTLGVLTLGGVLLENQVLRLKKQKNQCISHAELHNQLAASQIL